MQNTLWLDTVIGWLLILGSAAGAVVAFGAVIGLCFGFLAAVHAVERVLLRIAAAFRPLS